MFDWVLNTPFEVLLTLQRTDVSNVDRSNNLGNYLRLLHEHLKNYKEDRQELLRDRTFKVLLKLTATERKKFTETTSQCYTRLLKDARRFLKLYQHNKGSN